MADLGQRDHARRSSGSYRFVARKSLESPLSSLPPWSVPATLGTLVLVGLLALYISERLLVLPAIMVTLASVALAFTWPPLRAAGGARLALLLNVALILLYFWSLDERHHVQIIVTPHLLSASVDGDVNQIRVTPTSTGLGLQAAPYSSYRIQATGEAIQRDTSSLLGRVAETFRLAEPGSAWDNIEVTTLNGRPLGTNPPQVQTVAGAWSSNRRGELAGQPESFLLYRPQSGSSYRIAADLVRPDGAQGLLVGVDAQLTGYILQLRFDQPDALWVQWRAGLTGAGISGSGLHHLDMIPAIQRVLRVVLTGYLFALFFAALAIGAYPLVLLALSGLRPASSSERALWKAVMDSQVACWCFSLLIAVTGTIVTGLVSTTLLDRMPHVQDSVAYLFQAKILANGSFNVPAPATPIQSFFAEQFLPFFHGVWFSQYPPGHPLMLAIGVLVGAPWLVEPVLTSLSLGMIFLLGRQLYGAGTGLVAALLGLSSPFWLFLGSSFMAHGTGLFFASACLLCFARSETGSRMWPFLAGFCAGMSFMTRQMTALGIFGPLVLYVLIFRYRTWSRYAPAVLGAAIPLIFLLVYNWVQVGSPLGSTYTAWDAHFALGFGDHVSPMGPFTPADGVWNAYQNLSMLSAQLFGWPYAIALAFAFLPFILGRAHRWDYLLLASFAGVVVCHMFYWAPGLMYGPRYYYEALPSLLLLTARGVFELGALPLRIWPRLRFAADAELAAFLPVLLLVALLAYNLRFYLPAQIPLYHNYNYSSDSELQTVAHAHIHHAIVFVVTNPPGFWASYGNVFFQNDPQLRGDVIFARDEGGNDSQLYPYLPGRTHYRLEGTHLTQIS